MRKESTFEGVGDVSVSDNGGRFWILVTIWSRIPQLEREREREREREIVWHFQ